MSQKNEGEDVATSSQDVKKLKEQLDSLLRWKDEQMKSTAPPQVVVKIPSDKKIKRYGGILSDGLVDDWIFNAMDCIRNMKSAEAVSFVYRHLEGAARDEIKCQGLKDCSNADYLFDALGKAFGEKCSSTQIRRLLYERRQGDRETLREFSRSLVELVDRLIFKDPSAKRDKDHVLNEVFSENVRDPSLRRELKQFQRTKRTDQFNDLREYAILWAEEDENTAKVKGEKHEVEVCAPPDERLVVLENAMQTLLKSQQEILKKFDHKQSNSSAAPQRGQQENVKYEDGNRQVQDPKTVQCYYCLGFGHYRQGCAVRVFEQRGRGRGRGGYYGRTGGNATAATASKGSSSTQSTGRTEEPRPENL